MALPAVDSIRSEVRSLQPYVPGKPIEELERELGIADAVKLASNENPLGPSPLALHAIEEAARHVHRYPDGSSYYLREALSTHWGVPSEWIAVGSGSNDLIDILCRIHLGPSDEAIMSSPSFVMFAIAVKVAGGALVRVPGRNLFHDLPAMLDAVTDRTKIVYIANPDNPTGTIVGREELELYFSRVPGHVLTILDEAYFEYVTDPKYPDGLEHLRRGRRVAVLRTFSKIHALAGLRVGYGFFPPDLASMVHRVRLPFNVNTVGEAAARASLRDPDQVTRTRELNAAGLDYFRTSLPKIGLELTPSWANFVLAKFPRSAVDISKALEHEGVIIRPMVSFGLGHDYARISVGTAAENERLVEVLRRIV
ncbi:MAG TPA: histidinol-phosphate transaminase [Candidatus Eisenbacteria bacterium]|nr:histidinol-phosphate transaminase [Candidatus Eisenbacteria bacterium]